MGKLKIVKEMKLPKFTKETKNENPCPPWQAQMEADDFISCNPSYVLGGDWDKFDECTYVSPEKGSLHNCPACQ